MVDKGLYLPESWTSDKDRCEAAGVPEDRQGYRSKTELALEMVPPEGWMGRGGRPFGMSPSFREGLAAWGCGRRSVRLYGVAAGACLDQCGVSGIRASPKPRLRDGQRRSMEQRSDELPEEAWREITVAEGSQGPRSYLFSAQRVRPTSRRKPAKSTPTAGTGTAAPRYYLSNAPEDTPLETLAYVGGSRWRIETEFETEKSDVGLDE